MAHSDRTRRLPSAVPPPLGTTRRATAPAPIVPTPPPTGGVFAALRHRNYRLYWFGQVVSLVGTWMQSVSEPWLVLQLGGTPLQLGIVLALEFAPSMVLAPLGGVLADRVDKRKALIWTQVAAALQAIVLCAITATGVVQIWHIYVLAVVLGCINAVNMPVRQAFAAELVPRGGLMNAIALNSASFNAARIVGPAVAGITLALWGTAVNFGINAVSYVAVLAALMAMDPHALFAVVRPNRATGVFRSIREGVDYAWHTPAVLWPLMLLLGISVFGLNFQTLLPLFARNTLHLDETGYGALFAVMGIGSLAGSLSLAFAGTRRPLVPLIIAGGAGFVTAEIALGLMRTAAPAYLLVVLVGLSSMLMINTINVMVQYGVPDELRGRVMSLYVLVFAGSSPIGGIFAGGTAQLFGPPAGFVVGGALSAAFLVLVSWKLVTRVTAPSLHVAVEAVEEAVEVRALPEPALAESAPQPSAVGRAG